MKKEEVVRLIDSLTKKKILEIIDNVPNKVISRLLREHFRRHSSSLPMNKEELIKELNLSKNKLAKKL